MKKIMFFITTCMVGLCFCTQDSVVNLEDLTAAEFLEITNSGGEDKIVRVSQGTALPLDFFLEGDFIQKIGESGIQLECLQTFFVKISKDEYTFSLDGQNFVPFDEIYTGSISARVFVDETDSPRCTLDSLIFLRKESID